MYSIKQKLSKRLIIIWLIFMSLFIVTSYYMYRNTMIELLHAMPSQAVEEYTKTNAGSSWKVYRVNPERVYLALFLKRYSFVFLMLFFLNILLMFVYFRFFYNELNAMFVGMTKLLSKNEPQDMLPLELQHLQDQFLSYKTKTEVLQEQNEHFRSFASHELRNELAIMQGLLNDYDINEPELIKQQRYIEETVQDLLILSYDVTAAKFEAIDPVLLVAEVVDSFQTEALVFSFDENNTWQPVYAEANWLYRALYNLVDNALRYRKKNTLVYVEIFTIETGMQIIITNQLLYEDMERFPEAPTGHGIGLNLVAHVMDAIGGVYYYEIIDDKVISILSIPLK